MENTDFISRQIDVCKNDKKLVELICKLRPAPLDFYAHVHAASEKIDGKKRGYSLIGIVIQDYSAGEGKSVRAAANISPATADYIFNVLRRGDLEFTYSEEKLQPNTDMKTGRNPVTKLQIRRSDKDQNGKKRRSPWCIQIENGTAIAATNANGGSYAKRDSFESSASLFMVVSDFDMYRMFYNATHLIANWEAAYIPPNIFEAETLLAQRMEEKRQAGQ